MIGKIIRFIVIAAWLVVPGLNKWLETRPLGTQASLESPVVNQGKADQLPDRLLSPPQAPLTNTVNAVDDAPVANDDSYPTNEDSTLDVVAPGVLDNDTDLENDTLTAVLDVGPANGTLNAFDANGHFNYTPNANFNGIDSFTYRANDGTADSNIATVTINVTAVNDAPSFTVGSNPVVNEDSGAATYTGWATAMSPGPADESSQVLTFNLTNDNTTLFSAQPTINATTGNLTFTPAADAFGVATVTATLQDDGGTANGGTDSTSHDFTITITGINDAPTFTVGTNPTVNEDAGATTQTGWATSLSPGPANESSQTLSFTYTNDNTALFSTQPAISTDNGNLTFTPATNASGIANLTATLHDTGGTANGGTDQVTHNFTITVNAVNDAPSFTVGSNPTVNEDSGAATYTGWATAMSPGPADESSQVLTFNLTNDNTTLFSAQPTINATTGNLTFTPAADAFGVATVTATLQDDGGTANGGTNQVSHDFTITITGINDAPTFTVGTNPTVNEDAGATTLTGWATSLSPGPANESSQTLSFTYTNDNSALFSTQPAINTTNGNLTFTPAANASGVANLTATLHDTGGTANGGTDQVTHNFTITVNAVNDAPNATNDTYTTNEDTDLIVTAPGLLANDTDIENDTLTAVLNVGPIHGLLIAFNATGSFTYRPNPNYTGTDSFTYHANDGSSDSNIASVTITINPTNDPPIANDDNYSTMRNNPLNISAPGILENDTDIDVPAQPLTATLDTDVLTGTLTLNLDGSFTYTPPNNFLGPTTFTYRANDGIVPSNNAATVTITVTLDSPPITASDAYTITEDTQLSVLAANGVLDNDSDPDSSSFTATLLTGPTHGTLSLAADGSFVYTPNLNYNGTDSFYYRAFDGYNYSNQTVVNLTITNVNDAPVAVDDSYLLNLSSDTGGTLTIDATLGLLVNDSDVDAGTTLTASLAIQAQHGSAQINPDGSFVYTPNQDFAGDDSFTYQISDNAPTNPLTDTAQVNLTVDLQAPDVIWLKPLNNPDPANNENILYLVSGNYLTFEVLATDNQAIDRLEFKDWNPSSNSWFILTTSTGQAVNIKLDQLLSDWNQIRVWAYDTSGNLTVSERLNIWQPGRYRQFLAVMHK